MLTVEINKGSASVSFQVIQGGISIAGKRVGGLDALHQVDQLAEFMSAEEQCPRKSFLTTSKRYLSII